MNFNIPTSNRFENLCLVENTPNNAEFDDVIEIDVAKARQSAQSSKSRIKKKPNVVVNKYPENQYIFGKENINVKRKKETYTDAVHGKIKNMPAKLS